jgi:hypothetical protein
MRNADPHRMLLTLMAHLGPFGLTDLEAEQLLGEPVSDLFRDLLEAGYIASTGHGRDGREPDEPDEPDEPVTDEDMVELIRELIRCDAWAPLEALAERNNERRKAAGYRNIDKLRELARRARM